MRYCVLNLQCRKCEYVRRLRDGTLPNCTELTVKHPLDLAKVRMQTASARVGLLQTLKSVLYKEGITLDTFRLTGRVSCFVQRSFCIPSTASDLLDGPVRCLRRTERTLPGARKTTLPRSIDLDGLGVRLVTPAQKKKALIGQDWRGSRESCGRIKCANAKRSIVTLRSSTEL